MVMTRLGLARISSLAQKRESVNRSPGQNRKVLRSFLSLQFLVSICVAFSWVHLFASPARIWEETIILPTYEVAPPDPNPRFYGGRTYQGAKATFYPYP